VKSLNCVAHRLKDTFVQFSTAVNKCLVSCLMHTPHMHSDCRTIVGSRAGLFRFASGSNRDKKNSSDVGVVYFGAVVCCWCYFDRRDKTMHKQEWPPRVAEAVLWTKP